MNTETVENLVEEIMRQYHMHNYEEYSNEELRNKYRKMLYESENKDGSCKDLRENGPRQ